ncbi:protocadherin beta-3-like [Erpetoichthys calabaricus]|uniref:protocadherin beta-3-like n=1 Tax=Erpetoichthys calabaricus TaxID=27687 RepID=UPI002234504B|nr:protocadherin beta-3-like [Erpetoichthys calabaricus]
MLPWTFITQVPILFVFTAYLFLVTAEVRYSIPEEQARGAFIGNIAKDLGLDHQRLKTGKAHIYTDGGTEYVELNVNKGILVVKDRIDREHICGKIVPCLLRFQIILENPIQFHRVTIDIIDINDNNPVFSKNNIQLEISEFSPPGAMFSLPNAVDSDVGVNSLKSYTLTPNDHFKLKIETQSDESTSVNLLLETPLDRETQEEHVLVLKAVDGGEPQRSGTTEIRIVVLDVNDNAPVFTQRVYKASVREDSLTGSVLTSVNANDADKDTNGNFKYFFAHVPDNAQGLFEINPDSGEITVIGHIDYESTKVYEMTVDAKDIGGLVSSSKVIIEITDANDNAPLINLMSVSSQISEDSLPGSVIAIFNVQDKDSGKNGKVNCFVINNNNIPFKLTSSLNDFYTLQTDGFLDRENVPQYNITIVVKDEGEPSLSATQIITLQVSDVNDNAPKFEKEQYKTYITENNAPGSSFFSVRAKDDDSGLNSRISYFIAETGINNISVSSFVSINSDEGVLYAVRAFDYEELNHFQVSVTAKDRGSPPLSSSVIINVYVQDQNDNHPEILYPLLNKGSPVAEFIPRSADIGYLVTKVVAVDKDSGQNAWLSYKILKATDQTLFEVGLHNGEIRTLRQITEKDSTKQRISVLVEDSGQPSHSATVNVNVAVTDNFALAISEFNDFTQEKNSNGDIKFYLVLSLVIVSLLFVIFLIVLIFLKFHKWRQSKLFNECPNGTLPVIPYYPPRYAEVGATGTLCHVYNYEVCLTTDSGKSEFKYIKPVIQSTVGMDPNETEARSPMSNDLIAEEDLMQVKLHDITFVYKFYLN